MTRHITQCRGKALETPTLGSPDRYSDPLSHSRAYYHSLLRRYGLVTLKAEGT